MRYWELAGEIEYRRLLWSVVILGGLAAEQGRLKAELARLTFGL